MQLRNRTAVILGVADQTSIAWGIARRLLEHGAKVHIGYQQKFFSRVRLLLLENPAVEGDRCDVLQEAELEAFFGKFKDTPIDVLVHCIAYGPPDVFTDPPSQVKAESFRQTLEISTHSFLKVAGHAKPYLSEWGSVMTLTYQASEQASPFYGMMGVAKAALESCVRYLAIELGAKKVRVNAISPGPIATPAAMGEVLSFLRNPASVDTPAGKVFKRALQRIQADPALAGENELTKATALWDVVQKRIASECAIEELVTQDDVADCALFLASDLSRKITGQVIRIDCGLSSSRLMPESE
jgi:enoyl-[acyl-carrier protein] reductase I